MTGGVRVGYHARGSNELVPVVALPDPGARAGGASLAEPARAPAGASRRGGSTSPAGDGGAVTVAPVVPGLPHGEVALDRGRLHLRLRRPLLLPGPPRPAAAAGRGGRRALGGGGGRTTSTPASASSPCRSARRYGRVVAVEADRIAARYARNNARRNRLPNVEVVPQAVESWIAAAARRRSTAWSSIRRAPASPRASARRCSSAAPARAHLRLLPPRHPGPRPARSSSRAYARRERRPLRPLPPDRAHGDGGADGAGASSACEPAARPTGGPSGGISNLCCVSVPALLSVEEHEAEGVPFAWATPWQPMQPPMLYPLRRIPGRREVGVARVRLKAVAGIRGMTVSLNGGTGDTPGGKPWKCCNPSLVSMTGSPGRGAGRCPWGRSD